MRVTIPDPGYQVDRSQRVTARPVSAFRAADDDSLRDWLQKSEKQQSLPSILTRCCCDLWTMRMLLSLIPRCLVCPTGSLHFTSQDILHSSSSPRMPAPANTEQLTPFSLRKRVNASPFPCVTFICSASVPVITSINPFQSA